MDDVTNKALKFISENHALVQGIGSMAGAYRERAHESGSELPIDVLARFIFDTFIDVTTVNGRSPFENAMMMNVVMAITDASGFDL